MILINFNLPLLFHQIIGETEINAILFFKLDYSRFSPIIKLLRNRISF